MTAPYYQDDHVSVYSGDCLDVMATLPDECIDAVVTDPPYGLEFMGREWDSFGDVVHDPAVIGGFQDGYGGNPFSRSRIRYGREGAAMVNFQQWCTTWATECHRVLKPGGHLLAFGGTRTWHRLACAIEDAGFEIRDSIAWLYGSGFPKSLDVSKAIDKRPGVTRHADFAAHLAERREAAGLSRADVSERVVGTRSGACWNWEHHQFPESKWWPTLRDLLGMDGARWDAVIADAEREITRHATREAVAGTTITFDQRSSTERERRDIPATDAAKQWQGWGTALKPAFEPVVVARKPLGGRIDVRGRVEFELRQRGVSGAIEWKSSAALAENSSTAESSGTTPSAAAAVTSARSVSAPETRDTASVTAKCTENLAAGGAPTTQTGTDQSSGVAIVNCGSRSSTTTVQPADAAASTGNRSSPSTTSTAAATRTESPYTARSMPNCDGSGSLLDTESFAGIATGLTGSQAHVLIKRNQEGSFDWPDGLPESVAVGSTVAANVQAYGTGALNIDGCRVALSDGERAPSGSGDMRGGAIYAQDEWSRTQMANGGNVTPVAGRWPTNVVIDEHTAAGIDEQSGVQRDGVAVRHRGVTNAVAYGGNIGRLPEGTPDMGYGGEGGASRFFPTFRSGVVYERCPYYGSPLGDCVGLVCVDCAPERNEFPTFRYEAKAPTTERPSANGVAHPTVKPLDLMRWLVRLVTPPHGLVLDPFAGSGTTAEACIHEHMRCITIEREPDYLPLIVARLNKPMAIGFDFGEELA